MKKTLTIKPGQYEKKMENTQTKTNGHTWKSPFLALCPGLPSNSTLLCSQLLARVPPILFPSKLPENSSVLRICLSSFFSKTSFPFLLLFPPPFSVSRICLFNDLCCSHLFCLTPSAATFSARGTPLQKVPPRVKVLLQLQKARLIPYGH